MSTNTPEIKEEAVSGSREKIQPPPMYRVLLHNDDYTTMEFVVDILRVVFNKNSGEATQIMLNVHNEGVGICGVYPYEVAETKVSTVHNLASEREFPLQSTIELE